MSKAKSDYLFARSAESLIWSRMCIVSAGGGANNYISTGKVEGINNKKSDEAKCMWIQGRNVF